MSDEGHVCPVAVRADNGRAVVAVYPVDVESVAGCYLSYLFAAGIVVDTIERNLQMMAELVLGKEDLFDQFQFLQEKGF
jgi:hypothetical protein